MREGADRSLLPLMTTTSKSYADYVVFVESKALRGRSKQQYLRQVRKLGEHYARRELVGVTEREVFDYLVHRREVEKLRPPTLNRAVLALFELYRDAERLSKQDRGKSTWRMRSPSPIAQSSHSLTSLCVQSMSGRLSSEKL